MQIDSYKKFLKAFLSEVKNTGISLDELDLDHLGYQTSSSQDYDNVKAEILKIATLGKETVLDDRRIGIFILNKFLNYEDYSISIVEVIEPKKGELKTSHWEHVEFTYKGDIEKLIESYPDLNWDESSLHRDRFPMLKLKLTKEFQVKFPRMGLKSHLRYSNN